MKHLVILLGSSGIGKTSTISGPRAKGKRIGETHAGHDCLMTRYAWHEGPPTTRVRSGAIVAGKTRVIELGPRPIAAPWRFDGGDWNADGRVYTLRELFNRYDCVLCDSLTLAASPAGLRVATAINVTLTIAHFTGSTRLFERTDRPVIPVAESPSGLIRANIGLALARWRDAGARIHALTPPYVDGLYVLLEALP